MILRGLRPLWMASKHSHDKPMLLHTETALLLDPVSLLVELLWSTFLCDPSQDQRGGELAQLFQTIYVGAFIHEPATLSGTLFCRHFRDCRINRRSAVWNNWNLGIFYLRSAVRTSFCMNIVKDVGRSAVTLLRLSVLLASVHANKVDLRFGPSELPKAVAAPRYQKLR